MRDRDDYYADYDMPDAYERPLTRREKKQQKKLAKQAEEIRRLSERLRQSAAGILGNSGNQNPV